MDNSSSSAPNQTMQNTKVKHDRKARRFVLDLGNKQLARIDYKSVGGNVLDMYHTEVPIELRGRGIGKALASGALDLVERDQMKVRLSCSYLQDYIEHHADPRHKQLLEQ